MTNQQLQEKRKVKYLIDVTCIFLIAHVYYTVNSIKMFDSHYIVCN